ncbi:hypothetical protein D0860_03574 [Hortaea werneckii]|uniref:Amino acid permease/ SLC12A domain-containing protein n=1 Tax=Hortaea werneckii TaxID=91943 RepID=A0A3M7HCB1_HORWE|nr:hypothetical protein D0860_03574 [Hortaea werneckii]
MDNKGDSTITTYDREPGVEMSSSVPTEYRGTTADARDMKVLGKTQVLRVFAGWLSAIGWQVYLAGVCFMVGGLIQALISLNNESYVPERWHQTLLTIAVVSTSVVFNTVLAVKLPLIEVLVVVIPLWAMAPSKPVNTALFDYTHVGGWDTKGLAALVGMVTPLNVLIGYDCTVHMAEELYDASITLPKVIMWSVAPNACLGLLVILTLAFCSGNLEEVLQTRTGEPFVQIFYNATGSKAASSVMVAIVIILLVSCCFSEVATASRQLWSFARDKGLPASSWLEQVQPGWNIPLRAVVVSFVVVLLLSLINIGSTTALRSISSLGAVAILGSYLVTIGTLIWRRLYGAPLPTRRWSLGRYGLAINIIAVCFVLPLFVFAFFPLTKEVDRETLNYASVMFIGVLCIALVYYVFRGRNLYVGPVALIEKNRS